MSKPEAPCQPSKVLDLPESWLAHLFQHVASGPGGLARAAVLSQTCKSLHALSSSSAVTYRNLELGGFVSSPYDPLWKWLAARQGRIAGLSIKLRIQAPYVPEDDDYAEDYMAGGVEWTRPLKILSAIQQLQLTVVLTYDGIDGDDGTIVPWLKRYSHVMDELTADISVAVDGLTLGDFCEAATSCKSLKLHVCDLIEGSLDLSALATVAGVLVGLSIDSGEEFRDGPLGDLGSLTCLSHLTALDFSFQDLIEGDPFVALAGLQSLQDLSLELAASADPSSLSALTGLSSLRLTSLEGLIADEPFKFSTLQPLSTLQRLEVLMLAANCCTASSLQGLAGLTKLKELDLRSAYELESLSGVSTALTSLRLQTAPNLRSLSGMSDLVLLQRLMLVGCGVRSLRGLESSSSLVELTVERCCITSLAGLEGTLSMCLQWLNLSSCGLLCQLSGIEKLHALLMLEVSHCGVTSLQPLAGLPEGLEKLYVEDCPFVEEKVLELPHVQPTADVRVISCSSVQEVVLAGGIKWAVPD